MAIIRIVRLSFKNENIEDFLRLFTKSKDIILNFDGCLSLDIYKDYHHPNVYYTYSQWMSQESLDNYRMSPFFKETWDKTKALFNDKPQAFSLSEMDLHSTIKS